MCDLPYIKMIPLIIIIHPTSRCRITNLVGWAGAASHSSSLLTQLVAHAGNILKAKSECPIKIVLNILSLADIDFLIHSYHELPVRGTLSDHTILLLHKQPSGKDEGWEGGTFRLLVPELAWHN